VPPPDPRDEVVRAWRRALRLPERSGEIDRSVVAHLREAGPVSASLPSDALLRNAERLMRRFLRQSWLKLPRGERRALMDAAHCFDPADAMLALTPEQANCAAWMLVAMHWCGCRHPAGLHCKPLHSPTGLVRWVSTFDVCHQVDRPVDIMRRLVAEMERTERESVRLVDAMLARAEGVALLPELLR
jgi:hypothetical protein